jgi:hypothetical protein
MTSETVARCKRCRASSEERREQSYADPNFGRQVSFASSWSARFASACPSAAFGEDDDNRDHAAKPTTPTVFLDLRTTYAAIPGGALGIGFGNTRFERVTFAFGGQGLFERHARLFRSATAASKI